MTVVHVSFTCAADYLARREPVRGAHIERLLRLRAAGVLVAGGPTPDGRQRRALLPRAAPGGPAPIVEEDPYHQVGAWTAYVPRDFETFVDPWEAEPPVVLDGSRPAVDRRGAHRGSRHGPARAGRAARRGPHRLRRLPPGGDTLAVARTPDADEATGWLAESGSWKPGDLAVRPWLYVI